MLGRFPRRVERALVFDLDLHRNRHRPPFVLPYPVSGREIRGRREPADVLAAPNAEIIQGIKFKDGEKLTERAA